MPKELSLLQAIYQSTVSLEDYVLAEVTRDHPKCLFWQGFFDLCQRKADEAEVGGVSLLSYCIFPLPDSWIGQRIAKQTDLSQGVMGRVDLVKRVLGNKNLKVFMEQTPEDRTVHPLCYAMLNPQIDNNELDQLIDVFMDEEIKAANHTHQPRMPRQISQTCRVDQRARYLAKLMEEVDIFTESFLHWFETGNPENGSMMPMVKKYNHIAALMLKISRNIDDKSYTEKLIQILADDTWKSEKDRAACIDIYEWVFWEVFYNGEDCEDNRAVLPDRLIVPALSFDNIGVESYRIDLDFYENSTLQTLHKAFIARRKTALLAAKVDTLMQVIEHPAVESNKHAVVRQGSAKEVDTLSLHKKVMTEIVHAHMLYTQAKPADQAQREGPLVVAHGARNTDCWLWEALPGNTERFLNERAIRLRGFCNKNRGVPWGTDGQLHPSLASIKVLAGLSVEECYYFNYPAPKIGIDSLRILADLGANQLSVQSGRLAKRTAEIAIAASASKRCSPTNGEKRSGSGLETELDKREEKSAIETLSLLQYAKKDDMEEMLPASASKESAQTSNEGLSEHEIEAIMHWCEENKEPNIRPCGPRNKITSQCNSEYDEVLSDLSESSGEELLGLSIGL